jgi:hydrogenase expression/formation protein HypD
VNRAYAELCEELQARCAGLERRVQFMEVCGTHTVSIFRNGIRALLPSNLRLVSGPGCPVCVTAQRHIDAAIELASRPDVIVATYGDMLRVPGKKGSLEKLRSMGADVRVVTSTRTAVELAAARPDRQVVFLGVGFETTAPATAVAILEAERRGLNNFSVLMCHKLVVPAMIALLEAGDVPLDGFLCPGHVSVIIGAAAYQPIVERYRRPCVIAGFEPGQILRGLLELVRQHGGGEARVRNVYAGVVSERGNIQAQELLGRVFVVADAVWRALGVIPQSGLELGPRYRRFDALERFGVTVGEDEDHPACRCGQVIQGKVEPSECPLFGSICTPLRPVGPCMVSSEGTCAAWYKYGRRAGQGAG